MLEKCTDFGNPEKHLTSRRENAYIESILEKYNIVILESCFEKGALHQFHLRLWINSDSITEKQEVLIERARKGQYRYDTHAQITLANEGDSFCSAFVTQYLKHFSIHYNVEDEIYLYIYDFNFALTEYAYGHAIKDIQSRLSQKFGIHKNDIFVISEPIIKILAWERDLYIKLTSQYSAIIHECYEVLRKYDPYRHINEDNVAVRILLSSELDRTSLSTMLMKRE